MTAKTQDVKGALHARDALLRIAADSDLNETAKLFAFCLLAYLASPERAEKRRSGKGRSWVEAVGEMMFADVRKVNVAYVGETWTADAVWRVQRVIANDIPRYKVNHQLISCPVPKTRGKNVGKPCGKNATYYWVDRDPETGEATPEGYCSAHVTTAARLRHSDRFEQWEANGKPSPPANAGGILARHFSADWAKLYAWADPRTEPLPNGKPPTPPRPKLTLIRGGGESSAG
jgi:hypothetical protein